MNPIDTTAPSQTESISFEFDLHHSEEKVWRAHRRRTARGVAGARYGWKMMGGKLVDLPGRIP